jgi:phosphoglycolate phosphatase
LRLGILFDFDGTLIDTFDGIVAAVHRMRRRLGAPTLPDADVRPHIGWGIGNLIGLSHPKLDHLRPDRLPPDGAALPVDEVALREAIGVFREEYAADLLAGCRVYPGIAALCWKWAGAGHALAVVSNKPERFARRLLAAFGLADPFQLVVGGDSLPTLKPDPAPLLHAAHLLDVTPPECFMIGDSRLDLEAGHAAGMTTVAVSWGLSPREALAACAPDHLVDSAQDLEGLLNGRVTNAAERDRSKDPA